MRLIFRKLYFGCIMMMYACASHAQAAPGVAVPMIGLRQGVGFWLTKSGVGRGSLRVPPGQHFSWTKEAFFRKPISRQWVGEVGLMHYSFKNSLKDTGGTSYSEQIQHVQLNATMYYDVSYPLLGYLVPYFFKMRSYAGISVAPRIGWVDRSVALPDRPDNERPLDLLAGVHYMHILPLGKRWYATSVFSYRSVPFGRFSKDPHAFSHPNRTFSWVGGIAYSLQRTRKNESARIDGALSIKQN